VAGNTKKKKCPKRKASLRKSRPSAAPPEPDLGPIGFDEDYVPESEGDGSEVEDEPEEDDFQ
jgi:hypothetical protein